MCVASDGKSMIAAVVSCGARRRADGVILAIFGTGSAIVCGVVDASASIALGTIPLVTASARTIRPFPRHTSCMLGAVIVRGACLLADRVVFISILAATAILQRVIDGGTIAAGSVVPLVAAGAVATRLGVTYDSNRVIGAVGRDGAGEVALRVLWFTFVPSSAPFAVVRLVVLH